MKMFLVMVMLIVNNSEYMCNTKYLPKTLKCFKYINLFRITGIRHELYVRSYNGVSIYLYFIKHGNSSF